MGVDSAIGNNSYNALNMRLEKRYSSGLIFLLNYTWSKNIESNGDGDSSYDQNGGTTLPLDSYNLTQGAQLRAARCAARRQLQLRLRAALRRRQALAESQGRCQRRARRLAGQRDRHLPQRLSHRYPRQPCGRRQPAVRHL